tara:strand:+ start:1143 stop:2579 length:1437 start_codon:yes stop_codon:yes gene_type:complete
MEYNPREDEKVYLGTRLLDSIEGGVIGTTQWLQKQAEENPDTYTDDVLRLLGGGVKNTAWAISKIPLLDKLAQGEDWLAGQARNINEKLTPWLDPRFAGWGTRIGTGILADKGARKVLSGIKGIRKGTNLLDDLQPRSVGAAGKGTFTNEGFIAPFDPERMARIKSLKNTLIQQVNKDIADTRNPYISQTTRMSLSDAQKYSGYGVGGTFKYKEFRAVSRNMESQGRSWLGIYQSGFTGGGASRAVPFNQFRDINLPRLKEAFRPTIQAMGLTEQSFQIHHMAALKSIMGIFDGLDINSPLYRQVSDTILKEIPGLGLGDMLGNLKPIVGRTSDKGTPHYLVHRFYNDKLGALGAGEAFFTDRVLNQMRVSRSFRLKKAKEIGEVIRESERIVNQAQKVFETLYTDVSLDQVLEVMSEMDNKGFINLFDKKYQVDKIPNIIETIVNDINVNGFPTKLGPAWWQEARRIKKRYIKKKPL